MRITRSTPRSPKPASIGETTERFLFRSRVALGRGEHARHRSSTTARCRRSTISPCSAAPMCSRVQNADGEWEVLQFANAELIAPNQWTLSKLLRGQAGTEGAMRDPVAAGARVVVLDGAPQQLSLQQNEYALPFNYLWGPQGKPISDPAFQGAALQFKGIGLRPLSPVQLQRRMARRRSRALLDPPHPHRRRQLGPDRCAARRGRRSLRHRNPRCLRRRRSAPSRVAASIRFIYLAVNIAADFPSGLPSPFRFRVYQLSATYGRRRLRGEKSTSTDCSLMHYSVMTIGSLVRVILPRLRGGDRRRRWRGGPHARSDRTCIPDFDRTARS